MAKKQMTPYEEWRSNLTGSLWNKILRAVNGKIPKAEMKFRNEFEEQLYDETWAEAEAHVKKYGFWPTFEMAEIDWDDPVLDIYGEDNSAEKWAEDRKNKK